MDVTDIQALLEALAATETNELTLETPDYKLTIRRRQEPVYVQAPAPIQAPMQAPPAISAPVSVAPTPQAVPPETLATSEASTASSSADTSNLVTITAPIVGTFYAAPAPDAPAFANVGDKVTAGSVLCIIEAMKLMNEIEAEVSGIIKEVLVNNEDPVEYGQVLFRIEPS
ncbi:MAG: acetyl-CoA carboxylase biotin carboxyl carrier protein [Deinococcota bacterium]